MPLFTQSIVTYPGLKTHLLKYSWMVAAVACAALLLTAPRFVLPLAMGCAIGYGYLFSLFMASEHPRRKLSIVLSIFRMAIVSFLIVWVGQFRLLDTCVVFCGFLSYKFVLILEYIRHSVGRPLNRGK